MNNHETNMANKNRFYRYVLQENIIKFYQLTALYPFSTQILSRIKRTNRHEHFVLDFQPTHIQEKFLGFGRGCGKDVIMIDSLTKLSDEIWLTAGVSGKLIGDELKSFDHKIAVSPKDKPKPFWVNDWRKKGRK